MSDYTAWLAANDQYLVAQLASLRDRLQRAASLAPAAGDSGTEPAAPSPTASDAPLTTIPSSTGEGARAASGDDAPVPALVLLAQRLGMTDFERDVLLLCVGMELDTRMPVLCAQAQHDVAKPWPTFALAFAILDNPAWDALSPGRPLRYWRLIDIHQPGPQPLIGAALSADERIVNFVKGMNYLDDRLAPLLTVLTPATLPPSQQAVVDGLVDTLRRVPEGEPLPALQLIGSDSVSKQAIASRVATLLGARAYRLAADLLPTTMTEQETLLRLWQRESRLLPIALYVDAANTDQGDAASGSIGRFIGRAGGLMFIDTREPWANGAAHTLSVDVAKPTPVEQRGLWQTLLGDVGGDHPQQLAGHFDFNPGKIEQVAQSALAAAGKDAEALGPSLWQGALARTRPALDQLARRIDPKARWADLKLPAQELATLHQIADQVAQRGTVYDDWGFRDRMNRGLSISALFAGESGTGKTMAAEVIANALGLSLYRIDLSAVVSKYIGETEKNLRKLFDAAEEGGAILFFDEADALFGRRSSEVKEGLDRYANIEVNYLLQRLESFHGLAILATNMKGSLDSAFLRRIRFVVNFPFPGIAERKAIWASVFPARAAAGALDIERLARLALTGGSIQGIALNAAFAAAAAGVQITMPLVLDAARAEYRKLDKPVNEADFRWLESAGGKP
jgi:hypothetical protein